MLSIRLIVTAQMTYDTAGRVTESADALGIKTSYTYDVADRVTEVIKAQGTDFETKTAYAYDAAGNLLTVTDA